MHDYPDSITIEGVPFTREPQNESHLWDCRYRSQPLQVTEGYPIVIILHVGTRHAEDDLAWAGSLYVGEWRIYVDALEYYEPEDTVQKCLSKLQEEEILELARAYITHHTKE